MDTRSVEDFDVRRYVVVLEIFYQKLIFIFTALVVLVKNVGSSLQQQTAVLGIIVLFQSFLEQICKGLYNLLFLKLLLNTSNAEIIKETSKSCQIAGVLDVSFTDL